MYKRQVYAYGLAVEMEVTPQLSEVFANGPQQPEDSRTPAAHVHAGRHDKRKVGS